MANDTPTLLNRSIYWGRRAAPSFLETQFVSGTVRLQWAGSSPLLMFACFRAPQKQTSRRLHRTQKPDSHPPI